MKEPVLSNPFDDKRPIAKSENQGKTPAGQEWHPAFFELSPDALMVLDPLGNFKDLNASAAAMFGYTQEEFLHLNIKSLADPEHTGRPEMPFELLKEGDKISSEIRMMRKKGDPIYVEANYKRLGNGHILALVRNITGKKIAQDYLRKSEAMLQLFFEKSEAIYVLLNDGFRVNSFNPAAFAFIKKELGLGLTKGDFFPDYLPLEKRQEFLSSIDKLKAGKQLQFELGYPQSTGLMSWYKARLTQAPLPENGADSLLLTVSDITELKLTENAQVTRKVQEQKNHLRAFLKDQETERNLIGQELHDNVNQMLSTIRLYLGMIENEETMRHELIERTRSAIDVVIDEIRSISKRQVTPQKKFDLNELIEDLIRNLHENAKVSIKFDLRVSINARIEEDLKLNIYRIVQEQINNILKHAAASKVTLSIDVNSENLHLRIIDDGIGFDPDLKRKGIGISNIFNRVESYNGEMSLTSKPGGGCRLEITIPNSTDLR